VLLAVSQSWGLLGPAVDLDRFAVEGVDPAPPAGDVEQVDAADAGRRGRVDVSRHPHRLKITPTLLITPLLLRGLPSHGAVLAFGRESPAGANDAQLRSAGRRLPVGVDPCESNPM
jgi:hypothetical protein